MIYKNTIKSHIQKHLLYRSYAYCPTWQLLSHPFPGPNSITLLRPSHCLLLLKLCSLLYIWSGDSWLKVYRWSALSKHYLFTNCIRPLFTMQWIILALSELSRNNSLCFSIDKSFPIVKDCFVGFTHNLINWFIRPNYWFNSIFWSFNIQMQIV